MKVLPLVSVNIIAFNRARTILRCVQSVLNQDYNNLEIIIIDDGSTDNTAELIESIKDQRIKLYKNEINKGINYTRNRALSLSTGKYISILDSDDYSLPSRISKQVNFLEKHKDVSLVCSFINVIDEEGNQKPDWIADRLNTTFYEIKNQIWKSNCIAHSTVTIRKDILTKYGYFSSYASEDYDLWLNLVADNHKIIKLPEALTYYVQSEDSATNNQNVRYSYLTKTRKIKIEYLKRRVKAKRFSTYDLKVSGWILASFTPYLKQIIQ